MKTQLQKWIDEIKSSNMLTEHGLEMSGDTLMEIVSFFEGMVAAVKDAPDELHVTLDTPDGEQVFVTKANRDWYANEIGKYALAISVATATIEGLNEQIAKMSAMVLSDDNHARSEKAIEALKEAKEYCDKNLFTTETLTLNPLQNAVAFRLGCKLDKALANLTGIGECVSQLNKPIDMILYCPRCRTQHIDEPDPPSWMNPPHKSHLCHACALIWRPCDVPTNGVAFVNTKGSNDTLDMRNPVEQSKEKLKTDYFFDPDGDGDI